MHSTKPQLGQNSTPTLVPNNASEPGPELAGRDWYSLTQSPLTRHGVAAVVDHERDLAPTVATAARHAGRHVSGGALEGEVAGVSAVQQRVVLQNGTECTLFRVHSLIGCSGMRGLDRTFVRSPGAWGFSKPSFAHC